MVDIDLSKVIKNKVWNQIFALSFIICFTQKKNHFAFLW